MSVINIDVNSPVAVRTAGLQALVEALGPVGFARFMQQMEQGYGDYTKEKYMRPQRTFDELDTLLQQYM